MKTTATQRVRDLERELKAAQRAAEQARRRHVMRIRVADAFHRDLKRLAKLTGREMSDIVRPHMEEGVKRELAAYASRR